ncbi:zinc finger protein 26-like [Mya arenaria]|uniref:zinc finger protein 26-like n=1 Tax=Mya arenaria TaxID=6604 RepID=UPI0022E8FBDA|nr:zinc finger protein 26-like [Mya arenaria]
MDVNEAKEKIQSLVSALLKDGYEALVLASHVEKHTFLYEGSQQGREFLKQTPQLLKFPDFCTESSETGHDVKGISLLTSVKPGHHLTLDKSSVNDRNNPTEKTDDTSKEETKESEIHEVKDEANLYDDDDTDIENYVDELSGGVETLDKGNEIEDGIRKCQKPSLNVSHNNIKEKRVRGKSKNSKVNTEKAQRKQKSNLIVNHVENDDNTHSAKKNIIRVDFPSGKDGANDEGNITYREVKVELDIPNDDDDDVDEPSVAENGKVLSKGKKRKIKKGRKTTAKKRQIGQVIEKDSRELSLGIDQENDLEEKFGSLDSTIIFRKKAIQECDKRLIDFLEQNLNEKKCVSTDKKKSLNGESIDGFASKIVKFSRDYGMMGEGSKQCDICPCCSIELKSKDEEFCQKHLKSHMDKLRQSVELCKRCHIILPTKWLALHSCICEIPRLTNTVNYGVRDIRDEVAAFTMKLCFGKDDTKNDVATCVECKEEFYNSFSLKYHYLQNHIFVYKHLGSCGMEFTNITDFTYHIRPACVDDESERKCYICKTVFECSEHVAAHVSENHQSLVDRKCEKCGSWFSCLLQLREHYCGKDAWLTEKKRDGFSSVQCRLEECNKWFPSSRLVVIHGRDVHGLKEDLCSLCGISFTDRRNMKTHMEWKHGFADLVPCYVCGQMYRGHTALRAHLNTHNEELNYKCDQCDAAYKSRGSLFKHKEQNHPKDGIRKTFTCKVCLQPFSRKEILKHHIVVKNHVSDEQPMPDVVPCKVCGKLFGHTASLTKHMQRQHSEKKSSCTECGKAFSCNSNLRQHMWTHSGQKPRCEYCKMDFRSHRKLVEHMAQKHDVRMEYSKNDSIFIKGNMLPLNLKTSPNKD